MINQLGKGSDFLILNSLSLLRRSLPLLGSHRDVVLFLDNTSINFPPEENLPNEMMKKIGNDYLQANGFTQHQFIMFRHFDADHPHLHILVNRIGYDGKVLSDSNDYKRSEQVLRELEVKYNLMKVVSSREAKERALTKDELEMVKRTNIPSEKMKLQILIKDVLKKGQKRTTQEFVEALKRKGIRLQFNQATTGFVSGISCDLNGFVVKGAALGNDFKWPSLKNCIDYEQERDRRIIRQTNIRSKGSGPYPGAGRGNYQGDRRASREDDKRSRPLFSVPDHSKSLNSRSSEQSPKTEHGGGQAHPADYGSGNSLRGEEQGSNLAALLDGLNHGSTRDLDYQSDFIPKELGRRKKKKRRGRRL